MLLVMAFLASAYVLTLELKRKEALGLLSSVSVEVKKDQVRIGDLLTNTFFVFILGFKLPYIIQNFDAVKSDPAGTILSTSGNWTIGLVVAAITIIWLWIKKRQIELHAPTVTKIIRPHERVPDITMMAAVFGILGAKLFVIFESKAALMEFLAHPIESLFSGAGLAIYGGLIVAFIAVYFYVKKIKLKPIHVIDAAVPALIIGYAVGRMGCQLAGDGDWGIVNTYDMPTWWFLPDWVWAFDYPNTVVQYINPASGNHIVDIADCSGHVTATGERAQYCGKLAKAVFPTPIYETTIYLGILSILWSWRKHIKIPGMMFFIYCILNGVERFGIEKIRVNDKLSFFGIQATQAEVISTILFIIGVVGCIVVWKKDRMKMTENR